MDEWIRDLVVAATSVSITALGLVGVAKMQRKPAQATAAAAQTTANAAGQMSAASIQTAINNGFEVLARQMHQELEALQEDNERLRIEVASLGEEIIRLHQTVDEQSGEIRGLSQHVASLEALLRTAGIEVPERPAREVLPFDPPSGSKVQKFNQDLKGRR